MQTRMYQGVFQSDFHMGSEFCKYRVLEIKRLVADIILKSLHRFMASCIAVFSSIPLVP